MNFLLKTVLLCLAAAIFTLHGETVFAGSNLFTFPAMTGIRTQPFSPKPATFNLHRAGRLSRSVTFSWSFPSRLKDKEGVITVYSLIGKVVARIPVSSSTGNAKWDYSRTLANSGLYIARIRYGTDSRNLKLMLWN